MDAVAAVGTAGEDAVEENYVAAFLGDRDAVVADAGEGGGELGEFVVMGGEQGFAAEAGVVVQVFDYRAGDG